MQTSKNFKVNPKTSTKVDVAPPLRVTKDRIFVIWLVFFRILKAVSSVTDITRGVWETYAYNQVIFGTNTP